MPYRDRGDRRVYRQQLRQSLRVYTDELKHGPCEDCGNTFPPECMDFDHAGSKRNNVATMVSHGTGRVAIEAEIAKCSLVCSNCHRIRTKKRSQHA